MTIREKVLRSSILPAALLALAAATPASAQYWGPPPPPAYGGRIPPQHIEEMVRSLGFQPVAEPRPRGPLWVTHAVDREGRQVRVLIDGYNGRVIDVLRRPVPPRVVSINPPNYGPPNDFDDDGPDYDYRDVPPNQRPADWPPSRPNALPQQGPNVIPFDQRGDNKHAPAAKTKTAKKKDSKDKKTDRTAALTPDKDKQKTPSPQARPDEAPKAEIRKKEEPKTDAQKKNDMPKSAQAPKMPAADTQRAPDHQTTGTVPTFDAPKKQTPALLPPVQPPF